MKYIQNLVARYTATGITWFIDSSKNKLKQRENNGHIMINYNLINVNNKKEEKKAKKKANAQMTRIQVQNY